MLRQLMVVNDKGGAAPDCFQRTAMHYGEMASNCPGIELLIDMGTDCNVLDAQGRTALHWAAAKNNLGVARAYLKVDPEAQGRLKADRVDEFGAPDIDFQEEERGGTALHVAVWSKHLEMAQLLVERGASKVAEDKSFKRPVDYAEDYALGADEALAKLGDQLKTFLKPKNSY